MSAVTNHIYWIRVDITLDSPLRTIDAESDKPAGKVEGAFMEFGVTAHDPAEAKAAALAWISTSEQFSGLAYRAEFVYIGEIDPADIAQEIYADRDVASALIGDPLGGGLWYRTGVGWYSDDD